MFRKRHPLSNRMLLVTLCQGILPYYRSLSSQPPFSPPLPQHLVLIPLNSPYMIHEAHSSAIRWHDTHPTTVPWNHAPWSRDPRLRRYIPSLSIPSDHPFVETLFCDDIYNTTSVHRRMQSRYLRSSIRKSVNSTKIFWFDKICKGML